MSSYETRTSSPRIQFDNELAHASHRNRFVAFLGNAIACVRRKHRQRAAAVHLASLSDYALRDIGIDRASIAHVVSGREDVRGGLNR